VGSENRRQRHKEILGRPSLQYFVEVERGHVFAAISHSAVPGKILRSVQRSFSTRDTIAVTTLETPETSTAVWGLRVAFFNRFPSLRRVYFVP
jgi:hypothetical protein